MIVLELLCKKSGRFLLRKFLILLSIILFTTTTSFAAKVPDEVVEYLQSKIPNTDVRFDGVVILPDNTIYLPLFPSLFSDIKVLHVKESIPANLDFDSKPDVIIFNNDFVLLKVFSDGNGRRTVLHMSTPPLQVRTGLLPQDMLVPSGLILPENLKGIKGNLNIDTQNEDVIKSNTKESFEEFLSDNDKIGKQSLIPLLADKSIYISTNYSKNIQVLEPATSSPVYSLAQKSIPIDVEPVRNGKFLMVTSYERPYLDIVSVADSRFIKQIALGTNPDEIIVDEENDKAYVTAPSSSMIFVIDLKTMSIIQKIRINGYCEKLLLAENKIFYVDKMKSDIWAIETDNGYALRNVGQFPNASSLAFSNNKLYIASRTKNRIAVIDYNTLGLEHEFLIDNKPVSIIKYGNILYVLSAQNNIVQVINTETDEFTGKIKIPGDGFSSKFNLIPDTHYAVIADVKLNNYSILDLNTGELVKTYSVNIPIKDVKIAEKVKLFD